jgi:hypothetical protein
MENMNPIKGGDEYLNPLNMAPAGQGGEPAPADSQRTLALEPILRSVAERIVKREAQDVLPKAAKLSGSAWATWVKEFSLDHADYVKRQLQPIATAMGGTIESDEVARQYCQSKLADWCTGAVDEKEERAYQWLKACILSTPN